MTWSSPIPPAQLSWKKSPTRRQASFTRNPWLQRPGGKNRKSLRDRYVRYNLLPSTLAAGSQTVRNRRFSPILLLLEEKTVGPRGSRCRETIQLVGNSSLAAAACLSCHSVLTLWQRNPTPRPGLPATTHQPLSTGRSVSRSLPPRVPVPVSSPPSRSLAHGPSRRWR